MLGRFNIAVSQVFSDSHYFLPDTTDGNTDVKKSENCAVTKFLLDCVQVFCE
jgi:hypothetical protein